MNTETLIKDNNKPATKGKYPDHREMIMKGNFAAAEAARLCRVGFIPAYPITPQTTIVERLSQMVADGESDATYINMDSEHSVFAAAMGAAVTGERVFTATAGQGLFYAHEAVQAISHFRLPMVMCNVGRPSIPWNIWSDQSDSLSQRDTGWIQYYGESSQEVLDTIIQSYIISETLRIPVMVVLDAFYQSHTSENIWIPDQKLVDEFLPPFQHNRMEVDLDNPKSLGGMVSPEHYNKLNYSHWRDVQRVEAMSETVAKTFAEKFGRYYGNIEAVNIGSQTKLVLVTISSISSTARGVIRQYPEVGLLKIRLFRPFPKAAVQKVFENLAEGTIVACVERNFLGDREGAILQEMKRALFPNKYKLYDFYAGVGGKDVPPTTIEKIIYKALHNPEEVNWVDVD